ncbi:alpha/beta hydrolase [Streptomyces sp. NBC_01198]|uniref:alpha/beta hydrolase n=1 Tax=Streptomyces sp. NBC_01198 TaxID=2903769 RepID=UPI002E15F8B0|nr:alpha/beta hydrolase family protein [Streptomyces sp. NBC_01198]
MSPTSLRALLALAVVFVILGTTGWTAVRPHGPADLRTAAVSAWMRATVAGHRLPDPDSAPAGAVARFFASLTHPQALRLARRHPLVVGNLNGVPPALRYRANRYELARARAGERARASGNTLTPAGRKDAARRAERYTSLLAGHRQILAFDPSGAGRAAEVFGDLATATRVAVVVPGVDTNILTFERETKTYRAPVGMARALYRREQAAEPGAKAAVIAWADYVTPSGVGLDASTANLAEHGATRLQALLSALPRRQRVSLFCHSYGSVLCGVAAPGLAGGQIADITVFGSPGMHVRRAAQLHTTANVWAARDSSDWIEDVPHLEFAGLGHGTDPVSRKFGARVVSARGAAGHPGYFAPDTTSLANFTDIALGSYAGVVCGDSTAPTCTSGLI